MLILSRLFKSWVYFVITVGVAGFIITSTMVIHDSHVAYISFNKYNKLSLNKVVPNEDTMTQLEIINNICFHEEWIDAKGEKWLQRVKNYKTSWACLKEINLIENQGFKVFIDGDSPSVYLSGLWGDHEMANIKYLQVTILWLIISAITVVISLLMRKWLKYIFSID